MNVETKKLKYKKLTNLNFKELDKYSVVLVHSDECPDCEIALQYFPETYDEVSLYILDFDIEDILCDAFNVVSVPTFLFFNNRELQGEMWGLQEPTTVKGFINANLERAKKK